MRKLTYILLSKIISIIPIFIKRAIVSIVTSEPKFKCSIDVYQTISSRFGIKKVVREGDGGIYMGSLKDDGLFSKYLQNGEWAVNNINILSKFFNERGGSGVYIDIGANIGLTLFPIALKLPLVKCYGFEPESENFKNLAINKILNGSPENVKLFNVALSNCRGKLMLEKSPNNFGDHRLRLESKTCLMNEDSWDTQVVETYGLDEMDIVDNDTVAVKIDVQGAEPLIFEGGLQLLSKASIIIFEFSPYQTNRLGLNPEKIIEFLYTKNRISFSRAEAGHYNETLTGPEAAFRMKYLFKAYKDSPHNAYWDVMVHNYD